MSVLAPISKVPLISCLEVASHEVSPFFLLSHQNSRFCPDLQNLNQSLASPKIPPTVKSDRVLHHLLFDKSQSGILTGQMSYCWS